MIIDYKEFANSELSKLIPIQEKFKEEFKIDSFSNWFYDSESELLRLYNNDEDEVFFKYIPIGTYSLASKTWMWSWFNNYSEEKNRFETLKIKQFGEEFHYKKLFEGTFPSDEYDGWEFLAISQTILNGIGCYRVENENLNIYFLLINKVDSRENPKIKKLKQKTVDCENHGFGRPAFVCQHLDKETAQGFEEAFETYYGMELNEDEDFQAWCDECEKIRIKYDGWNKESEKFAGIKMICEECYFEMKEANQRK